jgi:membrane-bound lytic murein transglycosylase A
MIRLLSTVALVLSLAGCVGGPVVPPRPEGCPACAACPACPGAEQAKIEKPLQPAAWADLPGWVEEDARPAFESFRASCAVLEKRELWKPACLVARGAKVETPEAARAWFEAQFQPWALTNPDGAREGLITGYYEPVIKGSRERVPPYLVPVFGPPNDLIDVELGELYPELKNMRLRGRIEGRKLVPYYSRGEWDRQEQKRSGDAILWTDDPLDFFFMQIQGSGQVELAGGGRLRLNYADQNGHPFRSVGKWLADQGEMKAEQASLQGIKAWAKANPERLPELMNANPSLVFFRELPVEGVGPPGALGVPLTPERSIAIDPRYVTLGAPVFLGTTWPNEAKPLNRLMLAQDTGGAIRGVVRADFYWGSGADAGAHAGRMRQKGRLWTLMPRSYAPK